MPYTATTNAAPADDICARLAANVASGSASAHATAAGTNASRIAVINREARTPNGTLSRMSSDSSSTRHLVGVSLISATLLMTELALTRIFSV